MDYLQSFDNYLRHEKRVSNHTVKAYIADLSQFIERLSESNKDFPLDVEATDIRNWLSEMAILDKSPATVNRKISCLRSFFKFMTIRHDCEKDPTRYIKGLRKGKKSPLALKEKELIQIFDSLSVSASANFIEFRRYIVFELLYSLGLRRSELIELKEEDIDFNRYTIRIYGKGKKVRELPMRIELANILKNYLKVRDEKFDDTDTSYLVLTDKGKKTYDKMIYLLVRQYLTDKKISLTRKSPHILRHSFATHLTDRGAPLSAVRDLLGHSNLASTQVYLHNSTRKLKEVHKSCLPR